MQRQISLSIVNTCQVSPLQAEPKMTDKSVSVSPRIRAMFYQFGEERIAQMETAAQALVKEAKKRQEDKQRIEMGVMPHNPSNTARDVIVILAFFVACVWMFRLVYPPPPM